MHAMCVHADAFSRDCSIKHSPYPTVLAAFAGVCGLAGAPMRRSLSPPDCTAVSCLRRMVYCDGLVPHAGFVVMVHRCGCLLSQ